MTSSGAVDGLCTNLEGSLTEPPFCATDGSARRVPATARVVVKVTNDDDAALRGQRHPVACSWANGLLLKRTERDAPQL